METEIIPGSVYYFHCNTTRPPKQKYCVLLSEKPIYWFFINSEIPRIFNNRPEMVRQQIPLIRFPYHGFLDHDSFIDCSYAIIEDITIEELIEMTHDKDFLVGSLHESVIEEVLISVRGSCTIDEIQKQIILRSLS